MGRSVSKSSPWQALLLKATLAGLKAGLCQVPYAVFPRGHCFPHLLQFHSPTLFLNPLLPSPSRHPVLLRQMWKCGKCLCCHHQMCTEIYPNSEKSLHCNVNKKSTVFLWWFVVIRVCKVVIISSLHSKRERFLEADAAVLDIFPHANFTWCHHERRCHWFGRADAMGNNRINQINNHISKL